MKIAFYGDSLTEAILGVSYINCLQVFLPGHQFINYGKGGDTVVSLYQRIVQKKLDQPVDLSFLFVGVNDVFVHLSWNFPILKAVFRQPWAKDVNEFIGYYQKTLDLLTARASHVFAVSPLIIGEDVSNKWNKRLEALCEAIRKISADYKNVDYIDLRAKFISSLNDHQISPYLPKSATRVVLDGLLLRRNEQLDHQAATRGLQLTVDGVHLNSHGARVVAEGFAAAIGGLSYKGPGGRVSYE
ncbi:MAG: SGNH/GDSL hydrolase family protein [Anaerolineae bacterium]|nr:SGNH/GDSL hydrolase family protein [Anaerolineae bacterium]